MRKASVCGLAAAAVASGLLMASPVHAQSRTAIPTGAVAAAAGNLVSAVPASDGEGRRGRNVTSVGGVGNVTGSAGARGGVSRSRITSSGNVVRTRVGMRERPRVRVVERPRFIRVPERVRVVERPRFIREPERPFFPGERPGTNISNRNENITSVGGVGNITGSERARGGVTGSTVTGSGNVSGSRIGMGEQPRFRMEEPRQPLREPGRAVTSVGGVGNVTGSAGAQGGVRESTIRGSGNVSESQIGTERSRGGEETTSVGGVGNVTGSPGATGGVSGSTVENSGNVSGSTIE
ncbi:hypothetical protein [Actinoallomurus sp. NPDC050550]|uniref:hypothetical protein n=1 Tax=Actinoallomurus sp. NPDC050550 TaxID=3154937 RepID=UPI0033E43F6E